MTDTPDQTMTPMPEMIWADEWEEWFPQPRMIPNDTQRVRYIRADLSKPEQEGTETRKIVDKIVTDYACILMNAGYEEAANLLLDGEEPESYTALTPTDSGGG